MSTTVLPLRDARSLSLKILTFLCNQRRLSNNHLLEPCVEKNMHFKVVNKRKLWKMKKGQLHLHIGVEHQKTTKDLKMNYLALNLHGIQRVAFCRLRFGSRYRDRCSQRSNCSYVSRC